MLPVVIMLLREVEIFVMRRRPLRSHPSAALGVPNLCGAITLAEQRAAPIRRAGAALRPRNAASREGNSTYASP